MMFFFIFLVIGPFGAPCRSCFIFFLYGRRDYYPRMCSCSFPFIRANQPTLSPIVEELGRAAPSFPFGVFTRGRGTAVQMARMTSTFGFGFCHWDEWIGIGADRIMSSFYVPRFAHICILRV